MLLYTYRKYYPNDYYEYSMIQLNKAIDLKSPKQFIYRTYQLLLCTNYLIEKLPGLIYSSLPILFLLVILIR